MAYKRVQKISRFFSAIIANYWRGNKEGKRIVSKKKNFRQNHQQSGGNEKEYVHLITR